MFSSLIRYFTRKPRNFVRKVVRETIKESKVDRLAFRRDALAAALYYHLEGLVREGGEHGLYQGPGRGRRLIVSLTSIDGRLFDISTTIESLLRQSYKPDEVILWLNEEKLDMDDVPLALKAQMERGLTIQFCKDIGPHTKIIPALKAYPEALIITVDDDVLYPSNMIERLMVNHKRWPDQIHCFRARRIYLPLSGTTSYSEDWPNQLDEARGSDIVPLGVGGVLYPPGCFDPEVFNLQAQVELSPRADDIWLKAMSLKAGTVCHRVAAAKEPHPIRPNSQDIELGAYNVDEGGNDLQIAATFGRYGLWQVLKDAGVGRLPPK